MAVAQIYGQMIKAAKFMSAGVVLELGLAAFGAYLGGLTGLSLGWVSAVFVEGLIMIHPVYRIVVSDIQPRAWAKGIDGRFKD